MSDPRCPGGLECYCGATMRVVYLPGVDEDSPAGVQISGTEFDVCCEFTPEEALTLQVDNVLEDEHGNVVEFTDEQLIDIRGQLASVVEQLGAAKAQGGFPDHVVVSEEPQGRPIEPV